MEFENVMIRIGENMRTVRKGLNLSRKSVQDVTGISLQYIGEIERGEGNPTLEILFKLSSVYNVSIAELIGDSAIYNSKISVLLKRLKFTDKQNVYRLLNAFEKLKDNDVEMMIKLITEFKK